MLPNNGPISLRDVWEELYYIDPKSCDYYFETIEDFNARRDQILLENNNDLSQKTFGFSDSITSLGNSTGGLGGIFTGTKIVGAPKAIYSNNLTDARQAFFQCKTLKIIPETLFKNCPKLKSLYFCFGYCTSLTTIPRNLFYYNTNIESFNACFNGCSSVTEIPEDLFFNNINANDFAYCFYFTGISNIPKNIFSKNIEAIYFTASFKHCLNLISIPHDLFYNNIKAKYFDDCFSQTSITEIPEDLFSKNINAINFFNCFSETEISSIPDKLFVNNKEMKLIYGIFSNCNNLTSVPNNLFVNNKKITNIYCGFLNCKSLQYVPFDLFDSFKDSLTNVGKCFRNCSNIITQLPDVWNKQKFTNTFTDIDEYALNCTKAANYNEIPSNFGGPADPIMLELNKDEVDKTNISYKGDTHYYNSNVKPNFAISLDDKDVRKLALKTDYHSVISLNDLHGKINFKKCDYYFETIEDFNARRDQILLENNNDLSQKTFGFSDTFETFNYLFKGSGIISTPKTIYSNKDSVENLFYEATELKNVSETLFDGLPNVVNFKNCFESTSITSIPEKLFANNKKAKIFDSCFASTDITSIPENLFVNNINAENFNYCFFSTKITSIPENLFANNINTKYFNETFCYIKSLKTIPGKLFTNNINVETFQETFDSCGFLEMIPENLFANNINAKKFDGCFYKTKITSIPEKLFSNNVNALTFYRTFCNCENLTTVSKNLFNNNKKAYYFDLCFYCCTNITSDIPDIWNPDKLGIKGAKWYAKECTKAANYNEIPDNFKF